MTEMVTVYKGVKFTERDCAEAAALRFRMMTGRINLSDAKLWYYEMPGHELVMLLKELSARDKAQVFVLPGLKPARSFEETFSTQTVLRNEWIKKFARDCGKPIL